MTILPVFPYSHEVLRMKECHVRVLLVVLFDGFNALAQVEEMAKARK